MELSASFTPRCKFRSKPRPVFIRPEQSNPKYHFSNPTQDQEYGRGQGQANEVKQHRQKKE
jgi:hypothetical protein